MAIKGTSASHTLAMAFTPKMITSATSTETTRPVIWVEMPVYPSPSRPGWARRDAMALDCTEFPIPNAAIPVKTQKSTASHFIFNPLSRAYIGPPIMVPSGVFTLYLIARSPSLYLVAIPKKPAIQHHSTAPGPPRVMAVATPMMLPVPIVAAREVARAPNWLTSPDALSSFVKESFIALNIFL